VLTKNYFNTETASLDAQFTLRAGIEAPTVIYQNSEYWCGEAGCGCTFSDESGSELAATSYTVDVSADG